MAVEVVGDWGELRPISPMPVPMEEFPLTSEQARQLEFYNVVGDYILRAVAENPELSSVDIILDLNTYDFSGVRQVRARYAIQGFAGTEITEDDICRLIPM